jgi:prophage regulatory protein
MGRIRKKNRSAKSPCCKRFYRLAYLKQLLDVSGSSIWAWSKAGTLPKPIKLSANVTAWDADEIDQWCADRIAANRGA